jgi:hypothetical protein
VTIADLQRAENTLSSCLIGDAGSIDALATTLFSDLARYVNDTLLDSSSSTVTYQFTRLESIERHEFTMSQEFKHDLAKQVSAWIKPLHIRRKKVISLR